MSDPTHRLELFWRWCKKQRQIGEMPIDALCSLVDKRMLLHGPVRSKVHAVLKGGDSLITVVPFVRLADAVNAYHSLRGPSQRWESDAESLGFAFGCAAYSKCTTTLWVGNMPFSEMRLNSHPVVNDSVLQKFAEFGRFSYYASPKGAVFIKYDRVYQANMALTAMHDFVFGRGRPLIVDYTLSEFDKPHKMIPYDGFRFRSNDARDLMFRRRRDVSRSPVSRRSHREDVSDRLSLRRCDDSLSPQRKRFVRRDLSPRVRRTPSRFSTPRAAIRNNELAPLSSTITVFEPGEVVQDGIGEKAENIDVRPIAVDVNAVLPSFVATEEFVPLVADDAEPKRFAVSATNTTLQEQTKPVLNSVEDVCAWFRMQSIQEDRKKKIIDAVVEGCVDGKAFRLMTNPQQIVDMVKSTLLSSSSSLYSPEQPTSEEFKLPFGECLKLASVWSTRFPD